MGWCAIPRFGIVGPTYEAESVNLDAQLTVNFYVEADESGAGNAPIALMATPGIKSFVDLTPIPPPPSCKPLPNNFNIFNAGTIAYNSDNITITLTPTTDIQIGDTMFYAQLSSQSPSALRPPVTGISDDIASTWVGLIPDQYFVNAPPNERFFRIWYAKATQHIPTGTPFHIIIHLDYDPSVIIENYHFIFSNWTELTTLDQVTIVNTGTAPVVGDKNGTAIILSASEAFISFCATISSIDPPNAPLSNGGFTPPLKMGWAVSPSSGPRDGIAEAAYQNLSGDWIAPAGSQNSTWSPQGGTFSSVIVVNIAFNICPGD